MGPFHISALLKKKEKKRNTNMLCAYRVEQSECVFLQYELAVSTCHYKCGYPEVRL